MGTVNIFCVRMGTKYGPEYVERLRNMVVRHAGDRHELDFFCITDQPDTPTGWTAIEPQGPYCEGWWGKIELFNPAIRGDRWSVYFDLDTVIVGDLDPLLSLRADFAICANFTRAAGGNTPCSYGSCVMVLGPDFGDNFWTTWCDKWRIMTEKAGKLGDQWAIEKFYPRAILLQDRMPPGYFIGRRNFNSVLQKNAAIMVFAGNVKPHNTQHVWVKENWK